MTDYSLLKICLGFPLLIIYPGMLLMLIIRLKKEFNWYFFGLSIGFSIILLLMFGLLINLTLPIFDIIPLRPKPLFFSLSLLFVGLSLLSLRSKHKIHLKLFHYNWLHVGLLVVAFSFIVLLAVGALRLNNGFGSEITLYSLYALAAFFIVLLFLDTRVSGGIVSTVIYLVSLSLLLMTSLRGWGIVGHDIQREYNVFQLTKQAGYWSPENLRDAYDACMSISILPTILSELLTIPDVYVYKILFQILFAIVPVFAFLLFSRYFSRFVALLSTIVLISFPTFFTDMPMLNRQEIAFLLFMLMMLIMFDKTVKSAHRYCLLIIFGLGIILSHYSTTYIVILFLLTGWSGFWFLKLLFRFPYIKRITLSSQVIRKNFCLSKKPIVPMFILIILIGSSFVWSNTFTNTSDSSIKRVLLRTFEAIIHDSEASRSTDTFYSLFTTKKLTPEETLQDYKTKVVDSIRASADEGTFYTEPVFENFLPVLRSEEEVPVSSFGTTVERMGVDVTALNKTLKFGTAKVLQIMLLAGILLSIFYPKFFITKPKVEYLLLTVAGVMFLVAMVVIPVLSVEYGVLRAFQQILLIASPFVVMGGILCCQMFGNTFSKVIPASFIIVFFLASTGAFTQTLGGFKPLLHLNNSGPYYDYFYIHESETKALSWIMEEVHKTNKSFVQSEIQTDSYATRRIGEQANISAADEIYPSLLRKNSYVFLGYSNVINNNSTIGYNGVILNFVYPVALIDIYKNRVYDSNGVIVYR